LFPGAGAPARLLDTETGTVSSLDTPGMEGLEAARFSPWIDAAGQQHVAGRWRESSGSKSRPRPGPVGVARCTFPEGRVLDRIAIDPVLTGSPCWFPDRSDRILFAGGDGQLYRLTFPGAGTADGQGPDTRPEPIPWEAAPPGAGSAHVREPFWPSGTALGGRLVAVVMVRDPSDLTLRRFSTQIWWLELSGDASAVVAAGRVPVPTGEAATVAEPESDVQEHFPCVGTTRDGTTMLAYLSGTGQYARYELWIAPIAVEIEGEGQGAPGREVLRIRSSAARCLHKSGVLAPPAFSPDGRWLYAAIRPAASDEIIMARFAVMPGDGHSILTAQVPAIPQTGRSVSVQEPSPGS
jgi:hypothetical protein